MEAIPGLPIPACCTEVDLDKRLLAAGDSVASGLRRPFPGGSTVGGDPVPRSSDKRLQTGNDTGLRPGGGASGDSVASEPRRPFPDGSAVGGDPVLPPDAPDEYVAEPFKLRGHCIFSG